MNREAFAETDREWERLSKSSDLEVATLGGGCFWCMEGPFEAMEGVEKVIVGYAGGEVEWPTYQQVVGGETGHREAVQVFFDTKKVSYGEILDNYWWQIDPTDESGQFSDRGLHYTTAIFYHNDKQREEALEQINRLQDSGRYQKPISTSVLPFVNFYPAEDHHQDFYQKQAAYYQNYKHGSGRAGYIDAMQKRYGQRES